MIGYLDDSPHPNNRELVESRGSHVLGSTDWLLSGQRSVSYANGIGDGQTRHAIDHKLLKAGCSPATLIHPTATLGHSVRIGPGSVICAGVRATTNISIGRHVHINLNSTVGHDTTIDDYVTVNPLVAISGGVHIGAHSVIGTNSPILQELNIGDRATVGAGACVVRDVPSECRSRGHVAKWGPVLSSWSTSLAIPPPKRRGMRATRANGARAQVSGQNALTSGPEVRARY